MISELNRSLRECESVSVRKNKTSSAPFVSVWLVDIGPSSDPKFLSQSLQAVIGLAVRRMTTISELGPKISPRSSHNGYLPCGWAAKSHSV